jgi:alkylation response protein AidB-like acyl-CoA dehydrogenase
LADAGLILESVKEVARRFSRERRERQARRHLDPRDFAALAEAGFLATGVPAHRGGLWIDVPRSTRPIAEIVRAIARADSSVALVSSMHPAVLSFWLATPDAPPAHAAAWAAQTEEVTSHALAGAWWGTITSEPGSGGDVANTRAAARKDDGGIWRLSGQKHFGSGSGVTSFMITTALPEGESDPDWFFLDMRDRPWDGSSGVRLLAEWDGHGMQATQSHSMMLDAAPASRIARPGNWKALADAAGPVIGSVFTAVILGIVEEAVDSARRDLAPRRDRLRPYERVEWTRAEMEAWLAAQAYEGMLRAVERDATPVLSVIRGKMAVAELAESALLRICRVMGGGTFARHNPYGFWFEDVRALGFLRPPWGLAFDALYDGSWPATEPSRD